MAVFPSEAWCREVIALAERDPEFASASADWRGDFAIVMQKAPPALPGDFCIHLRPEQGKVHDFRVLDDADEADELDAAYVAKAPYEVWKALLSGTLDPVQALLRRKITVQGDVQPIIERARFKGVIDRVLSQLHTEYVDEVKR